MFMSWSRNKCLKKLCNEIQTLAIRVGGTNGSFVLWCSQSPLLEKLMILFTRFPNRFIESHSPPNFSDLIEGLSLERSDEVNRKLKTFYDSCMDVETIRTKGFIPGEYTGSKEEVFKEISYLKWAWGGSMAQMRRSRFSPAPVGA